MGLALNGGGGSFQLLRSGCASTVIPQMTPLVAPPLKGEGCGG